MSAAVADPPQATDVDRWARAVLRARADALSALDGLDASSLTRTIDRVISSLDARLVARTLVSMSLLGLSQLEMASVLNTEPREFSRQLRTLRNQVSRATDLEAITDDDQADDSGTESPSPG